MLDDLIINHTGKKKRNGLFGIEVEAETTGRIYLEGLKTWNLVADGSLLGYSGEYVLKNPVNKDRIPEVLDEIFQNLNYGGIKIKDSIRASVHIHLNVTDLTIREVFTLAVLYYLIETPFCKYCGENRSGNLFCLRIRDAEEPVFKIQRCLNEGFIDCLNTNNIRYASLNLKSLFDHGSLEFRSLETRPDLDGIISVCDILDKLKVLCKDKQLLEDLPYQLSFAGPKEWIRKYLGQDVLDILDYDGIEEEMFEDFRRVQGIIEGIKNAN